MEEGWVGDLHRSAGRYPARRAAARADRGAAGAQPALRGALAAAARSREHVADRKTIVHPEAGRITVDCDVLTVAGSDLRLIVYTAPPGSDDARALASLAERRGSADA